MDKKQTLDAFSALAQETRLDTVMLLVKVGAKGLAAGDIARRLGLRHNLMSQHLGILSHAGLVSSMRYGRSIIYRADFNTLRGLSAFLLKECCQGLPEIIEGLERSALVAGGDSE